MLCRTSKCGESPDSRCCWEYCWCWLLAVSTEADNHVCCTVLYVAYMPTLCSVWLTGTWFIATQGASAAPVTLRLRGRRRFKMSYIWKIPNCRWPSLLFTIEVMHLSTMSVASLYIAGAHPRPLARVCGRHSLWPMSVTCRARVSCTNRQDLIKKCQYMLNLRNVDCRNCSCYVACCEKQGLQI